MTLFRNCFQTLLGFAYPNCDLTFSKVDLPNEYEKSPLMTNMSTKIIWDFNESHHDLIRSHLKDLPFLLRILAVIKETVETEGEGLTLLKLCKALCNQKPSVTITVDSIAVLKQVLGRDLAITNCIESLEEDACLIAGRVDKLLYTPATSEPLQLHKAVLPSSNAGEEAKEVVYRITSPAGVYFIEGEELVEHQSCGVNGGSSGLLFDCVEFTQSLEIVAELHSDDTLIQVRIPDDDLLSSHLYIFGIVERTSSSVFALNVTPMPIPLADCVGIPPAKIVPQVFVSTSEKLASMYPQYSHGILELLFLITSMSICLRLPNSFEAKPPFRVSLRTGNNSNVNADVLKMCSLFGCHEVSTRRDAKFSKGAAQVFITPQFSFIITGRTADIAVHDFSGAPGPILVLTDAEKDPVFDLSLIVEHDAHEDSAPKVHSSATADDIQEGIAILWSAVVNRTSTSIVWDDSATARLRTQDNGQRLRPLIETLATLIQDSAVLPDHVNYVVKAAQSCQRRRNWRKSEELSELVGIVKKQRSSKGTSLSALTLALVEKLDVLQDENSMIKGVDIRKCARDLLEERGCSRYTFHSIIEHANHLGLILHKEKDLFVLT